MGDNDTYWKKTSTYSFPCHTHLFPCHTQLFTHTLLQYTVTAAHAVISAPWCTQWLQHKLEYPHRDVHSDCSTSWNIRTVMYTLIAAQNWNIRTVMYTVNAAQAGLSTPLYTQWLQHTLECPHHDVHIDCSTNWNIRTVMYTANAAQAGISAPWCTQWLQHKLEYPQQKELGLSEVYSKQPEWSA